MANVLKHKFISSQENSPDVSLIRALDWNEDHVFVEGNDGDTLVRSTGETDGAVWMSATAIAALLQSTILPALYPIGCIYTSAVPTNPATVFGFGTWTSFGTGRILVGVDAGQAEFDTVEKTGGAKTHALTLSEIASHGHSVALFDLPAGVSGTAEAGVGSIVGTWTSSTVGSSTAHNNLQPYITAYMWKRIA